MDIERYDPFAILGAERTIESDAPVIFMEFSEGLISSCGGDPHEFAATLLSSYKYCFLIDEKRGSLRVVSQPDDLAYLTIHERHIDG